MAEKMSVTVCTFRPSAVRRYARRTDQLATGDTMTPYVSYQLYRAARPLTPDEQQMSDERIGRLSASVTGTLGRFHRPRRTRVRHVHYGATQSATGR
jgi:hypothetical protein